LPDNTPASQPAGNSAVQVEQPVYLDHIDPQCLDQTTETQDLTRVPGEQGNQPLLVSRSAWTKQGHLDHRNPGSSQAIGPVTRFVRHDHGEPGDTAPLKPTMQLDGLIVRAPERGTVDDGKYLHLVGRRRTHRQITAPVHRVEPSPVPR